MPESNGTPKPIERTRRTGGADRTEAAADRRSEREEAQRREFRSALRESEEANVDLVQPTADEARNGWTAETLTAYLQEQQASASLRADMGSAMRRQGRRPQRQNRDYRPLRWRG